MNNSKWEKSMNRILIGITLTAITLNFWCLNYILPAIGTTLQLLGFRTLRYENNGFRACFIISVIRSIYFFPSLILNTTILQSAGYLTQITSVMTFINVVLLFVEYICLWHGFIDAKQKAGLPAHAGGAAALIVWHVLMSLLALLQYSGLIIACAMFIGYIFIIRHLYRLSSEINAAGYTAQSVPVKVTNRCIVISLTSFLLIGFACGYAFGGSYPMEWTELHVDEHLEVKEIKSQLLHLGFPEDILNDLSAEDIAACAGAVQVIVDPANHTVSETEEFHSTGVGVKISDAHDRWMIFHHFLWTASPDFYGTEAISLRPANYDIAEIWYDDVSVTGRVLYDKNSKTFVADYYSLGSRNYTSNTIFRSEQHNSDVFAAFSIPRSSTNQRGYVSYTLDKTPDCTTNSQFQYTHQKSWLQYPVMTAMENRMINGGYGSNAFETIYDPFPIPPVSD